MIELASFRKRGLQFFKWLTVQLRWLVKWTGVGVMASWKFHPQRCKPLVCGGLNSVRHGIRAGTSNTSFGIQLSFARIIKPEMELESDKNSLWSHVDWPFKSNWKIKFTLHLKPSLPRERNRNSNGNSKLNQSALWANSWIDRWLTWFLDYI